MNLNGFKNCLDSGSDLHNALSLNFNYSVVMTAVKTILASCVCVCDKTR